MSIKILTKEQIETGHFPQQPALLFPNLNKLFQHRRERLLALAEDHPMQDYLTFIAKLVGVQQKILRENPLKTPPILNEDELTNCPLNCRTWQRDPIWLTYLQTIVTEMKDNANESLFATLVSLENTDEQTVNAMAGELLSENFNAVPSDKALFIWTALMVYWRQLAHHIPHYAMMESGEHLTHCPVCHSAPTASIVHMGEQQGLRYLHCALCETEWNVVRSKCTQCDQMAELAYFMLDKEHASTRAETCDDCQSYLKIFFQEKDPHLDVMADDLASLFLDMELAEKGYARSGINPYFFTNEN